MSKNQHQKINKNQDQRQNLIQNQDEIQNQSRNQNQDEKNARWHRKAYHRPLVGIWILVCLYFVALMAATILIGKFYRPRMNRETERMLDAILDKYPDVTEEELAEILQGRSDALYDQDRDADTGDEYLEKKENRLEKYGYDGSFPYRRSEREYERALIFGIGVCSAGFALAVMGLLFLDRRKKEQEIWKFVDYVRRINQRIYELEPEENEEGALSILSNEIYKTAVLLKETSELNIQKSENLRIALQDISHQIKTPMTSIQIMLDNLMDDPDMDQETRMDFVRSISAQTETVTTLVIELLRLAKLDSGTLEHHPVRVKVGELWKKVLDELTILLEINQIGIVLSGDPEAELELDVRWETEGYKNILKNCIEHSTFGGKIYVNAEASPLFVQVRIQDEGEGIAPAELRHIFDRFYRGEGRMDAGSGHSGENTGIGLAFAKAIIERDGGFITVDSEVGKGTVFTVRYPRKM